MKLQNTLKIITDLSFFENKFIEKKVVFTNGCFDILHPGHIQYLKQAKQLGNILVVGLNSDESISKIKGPKRPINNLKFRSQMLSFYDFIDYIVVFNEPTPINVIKKIKPSILVKGKDYNVDEIVGSEFVKNYGGSVQTLNFVEDYSSSKIINKIKSL